MSLQTALFLVARGGTNYKVSGANIKDKIAVGDSVLVQRGGVRYHDDYNGHWTHIADDDLLLAWDEGKTWKVTGATFKGLFGGGGLTFPEVQECHRFQYTEYMHCLLLCESDYCKDICLREYTHEVELCYTENGFPVPPVLIPPPIDRS